MDDMRADTRPDRWSPRISPAVAAALDANAGPPPASYAADMLRYQFNSAPDIDTLETLMRVLSDDLERAEHASDTWAKLTLNLATCHADRFNLDPDAADLSIAVALCAEVARSARTAPALRQIARQSGEGFVRLGALRRAVSDLQDEAYEHIGLSIDTESILTEMAALAFECYTITNFHPYLAEAAGHLCDAFHIGAAIRTSALASNTRDLAAVLRRCYSVDGDISHLKLSLELTQAALSLAVSLDPDVASSLWRELAIISAIFSDLDRDLGWLDRRIRFSLNALNCPGLSKAEAATAAANYGTALLARFEARGDPSDFSAGTAWLRSAAAPGNDSRTVQPALRLLARAHSGCAERLGSTTEWSSALAALEEALDRASADDVKGVHSELALLHQRMYRALGDAEALTDAIEHSRLSLPNEHECEASPETSAGALSDHAGCLLARYRHQGSDADLEDAICLSSRAVALTPPGSTWLNVRLEMLATSFHARYWHARDGADLTAALQLGRAAVADRYGARNPDNHANLANFLWTLSGIEWSIDVVDEAIECARTALALLREDDPRTPRLNSVLSNVLRSRYEVSGDLPDLADAVDAGRAALSSTPEPHVDHGLYATNLASLLRLLAGRLDSAEPLAEAVDAARAGVDATGPDDPRLARYANVLAATLRNLSELERSADLLDEAHAAWKRGATHPTSPPSDRLTCALSGARSLASSGQTAAALESYELAIELLGRVAWHGLDDAGLRDAVAAWNGAPGEAASAALLANEPQRALELLEQGRLLLWRNIGDARAPAEKLASVNPELAQRLSAVASTLNETAWRPGERHVGDFVETGPDVRRRAAHEWLLCVETVRAIPGFERFLLPPTFEELRTAAPGPILYLLASFFGCSAVLLCPDCKSPVALPLDRVTLREVAAQARLAHAATAGGRLDPAAADATLGQVLGWLWSTVVNPSLRFAVQHYIDVHQDERAGQRIWWCPTGPFSSLPLHAAYPSHAEEDGCARELFESVTASYLLSARPLAPRHKPRVAKSPSLLLIAMDETPGNNPLPGVVREVDMFLKATRDLRALVLRNSEATRAKAIAALPSFDTLHFAGHARWSENARESGFVVHDGILAVSDIARVNGGGGALAVLSACSTAAPDMRAPDEVVNLASALTAAGFDHVVANLWQVDDDVAVELSSAIYSQLPEALAANRVAQVVAEKRRELRGRWPDRPTLWGPFAHFGI